MLCVYLLLFPMVKWNKLLDSKNINSSHKNVNNSLIKIGCAATIAALLNFASPVDTKAQCFWDGTKEKIEQVVGFDMLDSIQQKTWVKIPNWYEEKVREFIEYSKIFENRDAREFTESFIVKEMRNDWWISKENQLLFIYYFIFEHVVNEDIYDWEDGDEKRLEEFEKAVETIDACWEKYVNEFTKYMKSKSAENIDKIVESINNTLNSMVDFYDSYKISPNSERLEIVKTNIKDLTFLCKKYNIDYKAFFLEKLWDAKEVNKLLKLFEIE